MTGTRIERSALLELAQTALARRELRRAQELFEAALQTCLAFESPDDIGRLRTNLALGHAACGRIDEAQAEIHEVLPLPATPPAEEEAPAEEAALAVEGVEEQPAVLEEAPSEETSVEEAPAEEPVAEVEEPAAEDEPAAEAEKPVEPETEAKPKRRSLRRKKDDA